MNQLILGDKLGVLRKIDNEGLESIEVVKLKINGIIEIKE